MAITLQEKYGGPSHVGGNNPSWEYRYIAVGSDDEVAVRDHVLANTPASIEGLPRQNVRVDGIADALGGDLISAWDVTVPYTKQQSQTPPEVPELGDSEYEFEFSTESVRIRQSYATIAGESVGGAAVPDFDGAINFDGENVDGVDVPKPKGAFTIATWLAVADIDDGYKRTVMGMVGTMNDAAFKGYAAHEVMLVGVRGRFSADDELVQVSFTFAVSLNATGLVIGGIDPIDKDGWDYLWVSYDKVVDATASRIVMRPAYAYVERVTLITDFSLLGIGT